MDIRTVCVYCSSSDAIDPVYFATARELGAAIAAAGQTLVYGGTHIGLMGEIARSAQNHRGEVVGVIPLLIQQRGLAYEEAEELVVTRDLRERKHIMQERSDAFIALPGGIGTFEEALEILTLKQLGVHKKPIVFLNVCGYYDPLVALLVHAVEARFMKPGSLELYYIAEDVDSCMGYLQSYEPPHIESKWFAPAVAE